MHVVDWYKVVVKTTLVSTPFFYKTTSYRNTEARFPKKMRTSFEHTQPRMKNKKEKKKKRNIVVLALHSSMVIYYPELRILMKNGWCHKFLDQLLIGDFSHLKFLPQ